MATYEASYDRKCQTLLYWTKLSEKRIHGVDLIRETEDNVQIILDYLKIVSNQYKSYEDILELSK